MGLSQIRANRAPDIVGRIDDFEYNRREAEGPNRKPGQARLPALQLKSARQA
jgi:hypothetical protein